MAGSMARKRTMMPVSARQALAELPRLTALAELPTLPLVAVLLTVALAGKSSYPEWVLMKAAMRRAKRTCRANMSASPERPWATSTAYTGRARKRREFSMLMFSGEGMASAEELEDR